MTPQQNAFQKRREEIEKKLKIEESYLTNFSALRESYMKMLVSRFSFKTEKMLWKKAHRLAARDFCVRVEEMKKLRYEMGAEPLLLPALYLELTSLGNENGLKRTLIFPSEHTETKLNAVEQDLTGLLDG